MDGSTHTLALVALAAGVSLGAHIVVLRTAQRLFGTDIAQVMSNAAALAAALLVFLAASVVLAPGSVVTYILVLAMVVLLAPLASVDNVRLRPVREDEPPRRHDDPAKTA